MQKKKTLKSSQKGKFKRNKGIHIHAFFYKNTLYKDVYRMMIADKKLTH